jgi:hypothetical protein
VRLKPNWEFYLPLDDPAGSVIDFLNAFFNAGRAVGNFGNGDQFASRQFAAEGRRDGIAITDDRDFVKIANAFAAGAFNDQVVKQAIDRVGDTVAFAFIVAASDRLDHGAGLIDEENEAAWINPADFCGVRHRWVMG